MSIGCAQILCVYFHTLVFSVLLWYSMFGGDVMIRLTIDVIAALKDAGFTSYKLRKDKLLGESTLTKLRNGVLPSWHELDVICGLLDCQPGDFLEYIPNILPEGISDTQDQQT